MPGNFEILLLGCVHLDNPGRDVANTVVDDVLAPKRQAELEAVAAGLARFAPTKVLLEVGAERQRDLERIWAEYRNGARSLGPSEAMQIGFRVAHAAGATVHAVDVEDVFYDPAIDDWLEAHPAFAGFMQRFWESGQQDAAVQSEFVRTHTIAEVLRHVNAPTYRRHDLATYFEHLIPIGIGDENEEYPGPEMVGYWYRRNFKIACNIVAAIEDGDRALIVYGAGHMPLFEHIFSTLPGARVVSALDYLP